MRKDLLLKKLEEIEAEGGFGVQKLFDKDNSGGCPCFSGRKRVDGKLFRVWGRCWRVSENDQDLHYFGDRQIAVAIKKCLDKQKWYNPYTLIEHEEDFTS